MHARMIALKLLMAARRHGGGGKSGRYLKHDTARKAFIDGRGLYELRNGRLPSDEDQRMLFDFPGDLELKAKNSQADFNAVQKWADSIHPDPRSQKCADAGLDQMGQTTLLDYVCQNPKDFAVNTNAPCGAPLACRLPEPLIYAGYTLMDLVRDGQKHALVPKAASPGGAYIKWIDGPTFGWVFPKHTSLLLGMIELERSNRPVFHNNFVHPFFVRALHARRAYEAWAKPQLEPRDGDDQPYPTGGLSTGGPPPEAANLLTFIDAEPAFAEANRISTAQASV